MQTNVDICAYGKGIMLFMVLKGCDMEAKELLPRLMPNAMRPINAFMRVTREATFDPRHERSRQSRPGWSRVKGRR